MQANKEGVCVHLHASKLQIATVLARVHAQMHLPIKHANICVYISPPSGLHQLRHNSACLWAPNFARITWSDLLRLYDTRLLRLVIYQSAMQHRFSNQIECGYVNDLTESDLPKADQHHKDDVA